VFHVCFGKAQASPQALSGAHTTAAFIVFDIAWTSLAQEDACGVPSGPKQMLEWLLSPDHSSLDYATLFTMSHDLWSHKCKPAHPYTRAHLSCLLGRR
jgi:hypothetical protein